jgi:hypothetical protein
MANFLETLIAEWLEYQGYFVRRNQKVGRSPDRGDAVVMAFTRGQDNAGWQAADPSLDRPKVNRGHENKRRR